MLFTRHLPRAALLLVLLAPACSSGGGSSSPSQPPSPPADVEAWGVVGCSITMFSVRGYSTVGGQNGWPPSAIKGYPGGDISEWADPGNPRWSEFQAALEDFGAESIWFQPCVRNRFSPNPTPTDLAEVEMIADEIARRAPGIPIYASALADYVGDFCAKTGPVGPDVSQALADHLVQMGVAQPGPIVGPLEKSQTKENMCGLNDAGEMFIGNQLLAFFG